MNKGLKSILRQSLIYITLIGVIGIISYWLWNNPVYNPAGPQIQKQVSEIEIRFKDVIVKGRKDGTPHWTVFSDSVDVERNSPMVFFNDEPNGEFYNLKDWSAENEQNDPEISNEQKEKRRRTFTWIAHKAEYNTDSKDLTLIKDVELVTDDKDIVTTDELHWINSEEKAISNTRTKIVSNKGYPIIEADNLEGNVKLDILDLKGNVEIITELTEEQEL